MNFLDYDKEKAFAKYFVEEALKYFEGKKTPFWGSMNEQSSYSLSESNLNKAMEQLRATYCNEDGIPLPFSPHGV